MDLDENKLDLEGAKEAMKIPQTYYEIERLNYPRTVCTAAQHTEVIVNIHGQQEVLYKTICHSQCGVRDVLFYYLYQKIIALSKHNLFLDST